MKVAVVIVCYNSGVMLEKCLQYLQEQTRKPDQTIVVDNDSTDTATINMLDSLDDVEVMKLGVNLGYGGAINKAAENLIDYDYLCCLNPDAFAQPLWLESLMRAATLHPDCGSFASLMLKTDDKTIIDGAGDVLHITGIPWRRFHGRKADRCHLPAGSVFSPCAGAAMYQLSAFREVGGFDESFFMYVEDIDLGFRLQLSGYPCHFVPDAIVEHIGSATTGAKSDFTIYHGHRNLVAAYLKNMPLALLILTLPLHLLAMIWSLLIISIRGQAAPIFKAKIDALTDATGRLKQRRNIIRKVSTGYIWSGLQKLPFR
ncbi:MAG: glycosyltransferase family 2 protein [Gammaproteobacteria bacterium]|jgi:GT2 family glycosyltransferase|nr:glycosyltransferase family 2 protein [Gammaproteobacteria bacterium]MBT4491841.1 glycosyltransferase family 2 protein [Gammaproteobacteria bacterium]MBT7371283.1 glycosyltransferase family 2 protein [Gammaproteobacteria bacterium]